MAPPYLRPLTDETVAKADRAYWDTYGSAGVLEMQDGDAECLVSMRAALEAVWPQHEHLPSTEQLAAADARRQSFREHLLFLLAAQGVTDSSVAGLVADSFIQGMRDDGLEVTRFVSPSEVLARLQQRTEASR